MSNGEKETMERLKYKLVTSKNVGTVDLLSDDVSSTSIYNHSTYLRSGFNLLLCQSCILDKDVA